MQLETSHKPPDATPEDSQEEPTPPQFERSTLTKQERKAQTTTKEKATLPKLESILLHITAR